VDEVESSSIVVEVESSSIVEDALSSTVVELEPPAVEDGLSSIVLVDELSSVEVDELSSVSIVVEVLPGSSSVTAQATPTNPRAATIVTNVTIVFLVIQTSCVYSQACLTPSHERINALSRCSQHAIVRPL
jgi:hypothetical protein